MERAQKWVFAGGLMALALAGVLIMARTTSLSGGVAPPWSGGSGMMGWGGMGGGMMGGAMHTAMMGGSSGTDQVPRVAPRENAEVVNARVSIQEWQMDPGTVRVSSGARLRLTVRNEGTVPHNFAIPDLGVRLVNISPGSSKVVEIDTKKPGAYDFLCDIPGHAQLGQRGTVTIEG